MRGGIFHEYMLDQLEIAFQEGGLQTRRQVHSRAGRATGYIDLLACSKDSRLLVVEVEMDSHRRVVNDVQKRRDLGNKAVLWIVTPTARLAQSIQKRLNDLEIEASEPIWVLPFGAAMKRILNKSYFVPLAKVKKGEQKQKHKNPSKIQRT